MLKKGSVDGHSFAKFRLGECYESGLSVPVDYLAAMDYFLVSAREGIEEGLEKFFGNLKVQIFQDSCFANLPPMFF